jgi:hypothetical protein
MNRSEVALPKLLIKKFALKCLSLVKFYRYPESNILSDFNLLGCKVKICITG